MSISQTPRSRGGATVEQLGLVMNRIVVGVYGSPAAGAAAKLSKSVAMIERSGALSGAKPP
jgi:hypothetical protein